MKKFSRALSFVMTLAMLLSGIAAAEQQYFNNGGGGEFVDPHTFTKPYTVNEVIVPADEATGQVALEAHVKNIIEVDGLKFKDLNGDGVIDYGNNTVDNPGDQKIIGNSEPRFIYGINLSGDWNNFFVSAFFQGVGKQDWWPGSEASYFWGMYNRPYNDMPKSHLGNIWTEENPNTYFPRLIYYNIVLTSKKRSIKYSLNSNYIGETYVRRSISFSIT